jgi:serine protease Do
MIQKPYARYGAVALLIAAAITLQLTSENVSSGFQFLEARSENPPADRPITSLRDMSDAMVDIAAKANASVVTVFTERTIRVQQRDPFAEFFGPGFFGPSQPRERQFNQSGQGSGVIVSRNGYIVTNNHVVANADSIRIRTLDNTVYPAKLIGADPSTDIAIIKVEGRDFPAITLGDSDRLRVGEWILAIGSPLSENLANTVTMGIVSARGRSNVGLIDLEDFIQTDAAINPGNSGGALLNLDGELVGINTAIASRSGGFQGIGFAIPINMVRNIMKSIIETGRVVRPWIGIYFQSIDETMAKALKLPNTHGALVAQVVEEGPAKKAGLQEGDVISEVDGRKITDGSALRIYVAAQTPGKVVRLKVFRDGRSRDVNVTLGEMPREGSVEAGKGALWDRLGFTVETLAADRARELQVPAAGGRALVSAIDPSSKAFASGLRKDDILIGINRRNIRTVEEATSALEAMRSGDVVLVQVQRGRQTLFFAFNMD